MNINDVTNTSVFMGIIVAGGGFFVKYVIGQMKELKTELKDLRSDFRNDNQDTRYELRRMSADIADMKPKVNALWEHFLTWNKPQNDP